MRELIEEAIKKAFSSFNEGKYIYTEELCRQILKVSKEREALHIGCLTLAKNNKVEEALSWALECLEMKEDHEIHNNIGLIYSQSKNSDKAIEHFQKSIKLNKSEHVKINLALEYKKNGRYSEAFELLENSKKDEYIYFTQASIYHEMKMIEEAIFYYKKSIEIKDLPVAHYNLASCYFLLGNYTEGWKEYEWRWKQFGNFTKCKERFNQPYWNGENEKTILIYNEQGFGDWIMFYRFLKYVKGNVILECPKNLHDLFSDYQCYEKYEGDFDYHCSVMSLPGILGCSLESEPYLKAKNLDIQWENHKKIGICWTGNPNHPNDRRRSCFLSKFLFLEKYGTLYSFQKDIRPHVYANGDTINFTDSIGNVRDLSKQMENFNCTAKLLEQMDLIVTIDTSIAHLSGALGKKTFLLLPWLPDWRWKTQGEQIWYPSVKLFRQKTEGDWDSVFLTIEQELQNLITT